MYAGDSRVDGGGISPNGWKLCSSPHLNSSTKHAIHGYLKGPRMDFMIYEVPFGVMICVVGSSAIENNTKATAATIAGTQRRRRSRR